MPSNNDLVTRYLQAVGFWLPRATKQDILSEISEDLRSQIEDRASRLNRPLTDPEVADILKQRGRPSVVAGTFLPQHQLIGPVMFPIYIFVLKMVGLCYLLPWLLVSITFPAFDRSHLIRHSGSTLQGLGTFWTLLWTLFGIITFIFAMLDRTSNRAKFLARWDPSKLPRVRVKKTHRQAEAIAGIVFGFIWLIWLFLIPGHPYLILGPPGFFLKFAPIWHHVYPWIIVLAVAGILQHAIDLMRSLPEWASHVFKLATICLTAAIVAMLIRGNTWFVASTPVPAQWVATANLICLIALAGMVVGLVVAFIVHTVKAVLALLRISGPAITRTA